MKRNFYPILFVLPLVILIVGCDGTGVWTDMFGKSKLNRVLDDWCKNGGNLGRKLIELGDYELKKKKEAQAVTAALKTISPAAKHDPRLDSLHALIGLFQEVESQKAFNEMLFAGLPELRRILEEGLKNPEPVKSDLMFILKILAMYTQEEDTRRILDLARSGFYVDDYMWSVIFGQYESNHPHYLTVINGLKKNLPQGFLGVAYLDFVNGHAIEGNIKAHPFDSAEGHQRLRQWLTGDDEDYYSYAHSATAALPFIQSPTREELVQLAQQHPAPVVRMESAWALAKIGKHEGVEQLIKWCLDANYSQTARQYLEELGWEKAIPEEALDEDFEAKAEICQWLGHPNEFGRPPDLIELYDKRELFWPPTNDRRRVWLFKYTYQPTINGEEADIGIAMVGSVTFALFGESTVNLAPEEVYALHCAWELQMNEDPRAPEKRTVDEGKRILAEKNPGSIK